MNGLKVEDILLNLEIISAYKTSYILGLGDLLML
jgi:hypothetical protein